MLGSCSSWGLCPSHRYQRAALISDSFSVHRQSSSPKHCGYVRHPGCSSITVFAAASGSVSEHSAFTGHQAIIDRYRALLHEYQQHKAALADWLTLVTHTKQRQAQLLDAEATGDAALVSRFQQYLMIKKRLVAEIPLMREQLEEADSQQHQQVHHSSRCSSSGEQHRRHHSKGNSSSSTTTTGSFGVVNANHTSPVSKTQAVGQFFAAVSYRSKQGVRNTSSSSSTGASLMSSTRAAAVAAAADTSQVQVLSAAPIIVEEITPAGVLSSLRSVSSSSSSSSSSVIGVTDAADTLTDSSRKSEALSHLLSAATSGSSPTTSGGRATAAALAALAYKKHQQSGGSAVSSGIRSTQLQRPLAMQLAEAPPPPPGYAADGTRRDGSSSSIVIGVVETAKADANALRSPRQLESDVSLEATLQGVPGGLGAVDTTMFAATLTSPAAADSAAAAAGSRGAQSTAADPVLAAAAAIASSSSSSGPVGEVVTAKFDVYSGRRRVLAADALDDYFASLVEGHSLQLAASAGANTVGSATKSDAPPQQQVNSSSSSRDSCRSSHQKRSMQSGGSSSSSGVLAPNVDLGLAADALPLPT